jgi:hypothetical protein
VVIGTRATINETSSVTHHRLCCFPLRRTIHTPSSFLDPRVEHLRLGFAELIRSPTPAPPRPPPTSPPMRMLFLLSFLSLSFLPLPKLPRQSPPSSRKDTVDEPCQGRVRRPDDPTTPKLAPCAYRDDRYR